MVRIGNTRSDIQIFAKCVCGFRTTLTINTHFAPLKINRSVLLMEIHYISCYVRTDYIIYMKVVFVCLMRMEVISSEYFKPTFGEKVVGQLTTPTQNIYRTNLLPTN